MGIADNDDDDGDRAITSQRRWRLRGREGPKEAKRTRTDSEETNSPRDNLNKFLYNEDDGAAAAAMEPHQVKRRR